jgi:hypothetical protein
MFLPFLKSDKMPWAMASKGMGQRACAGTAALLGFGSSCKFELSSTEIADFCLQNRSFLVCTASYDMVVNAVLRFRESFLSTLILVQRWCGKS